MKILIVNYEYPPVGGGSGNAASCLAEKLSKNNDVKVMTSSFKGLKKSEIVNEVQVIRIPAVRNKIHVSNPFEMLTFIISSFYNVWKLTREWIPDLTVCYFGIPGAPTGLFLKFLRKVPYITMLRGGDVPGSQKELNFYHTLLRPIIKYLWKKSDAIVANSIGLKNLAKKTAPSLDIKVIHNGVSKEIYCPGNNKKRREKRLLYVGRLAKDKGLDVLLKSFQIILKSSKEKPWKLWFVGDGPLRHELEIISKRLNVSQHIKYFGWVNREKVSEYYKQADILVHPSLYEGMPNVLLEAGACGLPVVATSISGSNEIIKDGFNGFLVTPNDHKELADKLEEIISNKDLRNEMKKNALVNTNRFSWDDAANKIEALVQR